MVGLIRYMEKKLAYFNLKERKDFSPLTLKQYNKIIEGLAFLQEFLPDAFPEIDIESLKKVYEEDLDEVL